MSNQNALYEITTSMDKEDYRKFSYLTIFRKKSQTALLIVAMAVGGGVLFSMIEGGFSLPKFLIIALILIPTELLAIFLRVEYSAYKKMSLIRMGLESTRQHITFYDSYLTAEDSKGHNKIKYDKLYKVQETKDYYFIYASEGSASMVRKIDIHGEDRDGFNQFLKAKMGTRYSSLV
jgi:hypothetical protein